MTSEVDIDPSSAVMSKKGSSPDEAAGIGGGGGVEGVSKVTEGDSPIENKEDQEQGEQGEASGLFAGLTLSPSKSEKKEFGNDDIGDDDANGPPAMIPSIEKEEEKETGDAVEGSEVISQITSALQEEEDVDGDDNSDTDVAADNDVETKTETISNEEEQEEKGQEDNMYAPSSEDVAAISGTVKEQQQQQEGGASSNDNADDGPSSSTTGTDNDNDNDWNNVSSPNEEEHFKSSITSNSSYNHNDTDSNNNNLQRQRIAACRVHPTTPIPNSDSSLRILRKFLSKTAPYFPAAYGGTKTSSFFSFLFSSATGGGGNGASATPQNPTNANDEACCLIYKDLVDILSDGIVVSVDSEEGNTTSNASLSSSEPHLSSSGNTESNNNSNNNSEDNIVIESILGHSGDTMSKARLAIASFTCLIELWALESRRFLSASMGKQALDQFIKSERTDVDHYGQRLTTCREVWDEKTEEELFAFESYVNEDLICMTLDCAESLVAHGCLDNVLLETGGCVEDTILEKDEDEGQESKEDEDNDDDSFMARHNSTHHEIKAVNSISNSLFLCDIFAEKVELSAMKFLLTTGCRNVRVESTTSGDGTNNSPDIFLEGTNTVTTSTTPSKHDVESNTSGESFEEEAMLRGSHLLQGIRICYRVYLKTYSESNKTTARAALRQIVTNTFARLDRRSAKQTSSQNAVSAATMTVDHQQPGPPIEHDPFATPTKKELDNESVHTESAATFPSFEHKDAYLVLRSLCKLSMKGGVTDGLDVENLSPRVKTSNVVFTKNETSSSTDPKYSSVQLNSNITVEPSSLSPALDSKILALDLLLDILQRTSTDTLLNAGPHLIYAVRNYLCHSLLKNCTSNNTTVVNLSLRLFVPLIRHFRSHLKTEIEAFVTNVFFVILDSKNSSVEHKLRVVVLFEEICSDSETLAEIFLNYDCDLSAVDLFQRIVNTLAKVAKIGLHDQGLNTSGIFVAGAGATRAEKMREDHRELRLEAMRAVRQILSSLYASITSPPIPNDMDNKAVGDVDVSHQDVSTPAKEKSIVSQDALVSPDASTDVTASGNEKQSLVQIYDSKKKRREAEAEATLRFNQKPSAGIKYASQVGLIDCNDAGDVAQFLLTNKDIFDKTQIGEYLGREPSYQEGFALEVLHHYANLFDFGGLSFDDGIRLFLSGFRLPGEAQKIDRIMEKFAERYTTQNVDVFPTADAAFILAFSVIMLNTDLHNPAIKEERRMTKQGFIRNNSGICDGQDLPAEMLNAIFDRIKVNPISLKEDDEARERTGETAKNGDNTKNTAGGLFSNHYLEMDKQRESDYQKERDQILRNTESILRRKKTARRSSIGAGASTIQKGKFVRTMDSGLKDEYVKPMFDVTWGPALAVFSTVMESANGTMGFLLSIATDKEIELAAENAASATEVCLSGFQLAIRIAALCGNQTAGSAFVHALSNFSLLGTGRLLEHRHVRCIQVLLEIGRDDGELLGTSWEYIFKALCEIARLNRVNEAMVKASRAEAAAIARRAKREAKRRKKQQRATELLDATGTVEVGGEHTETTDVPSDDDSEDSSVNYFSDGHDDFFEEEMDKKAIDEANARTISENIDDDLTDVIYLRSTSMSVHAIKDFIYQLCRVSRMEISGYGGHVGNQANDVDLTAVHYRQQHTLLTNSENDGANETRYNQPDIYNLQKIVEVTHYNMDSRPRLVFADLWNTVSGHLTSTSLHDNAAVAMYAVDSFRQLSIQFLKRGELGVFEFQRRFLKPFESVMSKCSNSSVKEFLLKSVEQIVLLFGSDEKGNEDETGIDVSGSLRSGWRPMLNVIGLASRDKDDAISNLGFKMLTTQLRQSLDIDKLSERAKGSKSDSKDKELNAFTVLRADRFIDLVDALLMYVSGPREEESKISIDHLVTICKYLADKSIPLPLQTKLNSMSTAENIPESNGVNNSEELELWWPILLGLSRAVGDSRPNIRIKGLVTLLAIINQHFFSDETSSDAAAQADLQTLQLIFRGILAPTLENAEADMNVDSARPQLPEGFFRFMTKGASSTTPSGGRKERIEDGMSHGNNWLDTTFDHLMDGCISLALKSMEVYKDDALIEEVLAMFNNCLISDSGILAVRGLKRLNHFITSDLALEGITDDTWATVNHMLRRCLTVRGLPLDSEDGKADADAEVMDEFFYEFGLEEDLLGDRRYIGSNAAMIIGTLLSDEQYVNSMGIRWYLFLFSGLGIGIRQWDKAASILAKHPTQSSVSNGGVAPPQYAENALYARRWKVRLLLKLMERTDFLTASGSERHVGEKSATFAKNLLREECEALFNAYLEKEASVSNGNASPAQAVEIEYMAKMVIDLLDGICNLDDSNLTTLSSLTATLTACIQINDRNVRTAVHKALQRFFEGPFSQKFKGQEGGDV